jgi:hypothetical protein
MNRLDKIREKRFSDFQNVWCIKNDEDKKKEMDRIF